MKDLKFACFLIVIIFLSLPSIAQELSATEIIDRADKKNRGETSQGTMQMKIVRPDWERTVELKSWSMGDDFFLIYITAPAKDKGQVFLKRYREMWNWVPSIERMIKIPPSMMMQSWMGSDFTNDDLVKQSSIVKDYTHTLIAEETVRDQLCYKLELIPHEDAPVVWGKIISWVTKDGFNLWKTEYYDEDEFLVNIQEAFEIKNFGDRDLPSRIEIIPADEPQKKTVLIIKESVFNKPLDDNFFTQQNMKRVR
jgi:outer membrane lipoprotein-sorting protein